MNAVLPDRPLGCRLFDQTMAELRFPIDGEELTMSDASNMLSSNKVDDRKKAAQVDW